MSPLTGLGVAAAVAFSCGAWEFGLILLAVCVAGEMTSWGGPWLR